MNSTTLNIPTSSQSVLATHATVATLGRLHLLVLESLQLGEEVSEAAFARYVPVDVQDGRSCGLVISSICTRILGNDGIEVFLGPAKVAEGLYEDSVCYRLTEQGRQRLRAAGLVDGDSPCASVDQRAH